MTHPSSAPIPGLRASPYAHLRALRPLPGRVVVALDPAPTHSPTGLLHIPPTARTHGIEGGLQSGEVLAVTPRRITLNGHFTSEDGSPIPESGDIEMSAPWEAFNIGDRVLVLMCLEDVDREVIVTDCTRIVAVLE